MCITEKKKEKVFYFEKREQRASLYPTWAKPTLLSRACSPASLPARATVIPTKPSTPSRSRSHLQVGPTPSHRQPRHPVVLPPRRSRPRRSFTPEPFPAINPAIKGLNLLPRLRLLQPRPPLLHLRPPPSPLHLRAAQNHHRTVAATVDVHLRLR